MVGTLVAQWFTGLLGVASFLVRVLRVSDILVILDDLVWSISLRVLDGLNGFREGARSEIDVRVFWPLLDRFLAS